jgi:cell wall-associated NlpC family hydrolase
VIADPATALAARTALRYRKPLLCVFAFVGMILMLPILAVIAAVGSAVQSDTAYPLSPTATVDIPAGYLVLYQQIGTKAGVDWAVLAAIGKIECNHGRDQSPGCRPYTANGAGAVGPMQFLPPTWAAGHTIGETRITIPPATNGEGYAADGDGDGVADIWDPADAIASAARMLIANGAPTDYRRALFTYNHASWYVDQVLQQAADYRRALSADVSSATPVTAWAQGYLGTPYVWGGNHGASPASMLASGQPALATGRDGRRGFFDCSSLAAWAYAKGAGIYIGDDTKQQWAYAASARGARRGTTPPAGGLQPGDLVFFDGFDHVGIYLGDDLFIQAPHTGANVNIAHLSARAGFAGWVRYDQLATTRPASA